MQWLLTLDTSLFRFINKDLANPVFDSLMPFLSGNPFFIPAAVLLSLILIWKSRARGVLFVLMLSLIVPLGDGVFCRTIKDAIGRPRPFQALENVNRPDLSASPAADTSPEPEEEEPPTSGSAMQPFRYRSMPSSHAANWFAATIIALVYYRRSVRVMLPLAVLVGISRIYNGVHYPSDVLAGAIIGAGYAVAMLWLLERLWAWAGAKWFPLWWRRVPSLLNPPRPGAAAEPVEELAAEALPRTRGIAAAGFVTPQQIQDAQWLRVGYLFIAVALLSRLAYITSGTIQLSEDEAYQWVWSKHLALSYFSKPPLIAYVQFLGNSIWGDTLLGVRFFAPVITAIMSFFLLRFFAREFNGRAAFLLLLILTATPMLSVGSVLMTVDPLSVLFWTAAMLAGWRAVQDKSTAGDWAWVGLWMGLGFLSKYTALLQFLCWAIFFLLWPPARQQLRRAGPYVALLINFICSLPVLIWNWQHQWVTVGHVAYDAGAGTPWHFTLRFLGEFLGAELGLLNPIFFVAAVWAALAFWRTGRRNPRLVYFFCMGTPVFLVYLVHSFRSRVLPNWIAPSVLPMFMLMAAYWDAKWRLGENRVKAWLTAGLVLGFTAVLFLHQTDVVGKVTGWYLPVRWDPLHRVRKWDTTARVAARARDVLRQADGKPTFIICGHYGLTSQMSFWLPEARANVKKQPEVYCIITEPPASQYYFWPTYTNRVGENAMFINELDRDNPAPDPIPEKLRQQFESVTDWGVSNVYYHGHGLLRPMQIIACRNLR